MGDVMALDFGAIDNLPDEQLVAIIGQLRANRGLLGPMIRTFARQWGAGEWADFILSDKVTEDQLLALFHVVKREKGNGVEAVRAALASDPITGPIFATFDVRS